MKITFPHFGDAHLIGHLFFQEIGVEIVSPPMNTAKSLEAGIQNSPDEICLPFKLMVSNLIAAHKLGADTVVMPSTMGPCRLGEYGELLKSVLDKMGYCFDWIILDSVSAVGKKELLKRLSLVVEDSDRGRLYILNALRGTYKVINELEELESHAYQICGYEENKGDCKKVLKSCRQELSMSKSLREALAIIHKNRSRLEQILVSKNKRPLNLLVCGEIYSLIEPFASHHIEELLMDMGVSFEKRITIGWWIKNTILNPLNFRNKDSKTNSYMPYHIGGYAKETIDDGLSCNTKGYDGIIQIFPVGCMPEIVAKSVFSKMSKELNIKVLTVIFDEMGGEAGYITRIEAFVDMLLRKKRLSSGNTTETYGGSVNVLYGN